MDYELDVLPGHDITSTIKEAIALSKDERRRVRFEFNGVSVIVDGQSDEDLIYRDWSRALAGYTTKNVGPHPPTELTPAEVAEDARIEAQHEQRRQKSRQEHEQKMEAKRQAAEGKLVIAGPLELSNPEAWKQFQDANMDGYGGAVVTYSERWARLMQGEMAQGKRLEDVADSTSREADLEGITGFMYGCAVSTLSKCWKHGEQLRRWHNLKTQIRNEGERANDTGGVLNPALLSIGGDSK